MAAVDVRITGWVQGVSFRANTELQAERLGIRGWVRNEPDGSVAVHAEGPDAAVAQLVEWCHRGPAGAHVERVDVSDAEETGATDFRIRF